MMRLFYSTQKILSCSKEGYQYLKYATIIYFREKNSLGYSNLIYFLACIFLEFLPWTLGIVFCHHTHLVLSGPNFSTSSSVTGSFFEAGLIWHRFSVYILSEVRCAQVTGSVFTPGLPLPAISRSRTVLYLRAFLICMSEGKVLTLNDWLCRMMSSNSFVKESHYSIFQNTLLRGVLWQPFSVKISFTVFKEDI